MRLVCAAVIHKDSYNRRIEREVLAYFKEVIYRPLQQVLQAFSLSVRLNSAAPRHKRAQSALWLAIQAGTVWYSKGIFSGRLSAEISKELRSYGAVLRGETFALEAADLPIVMRGVVAMSSARSAALHEEIVRLLDQIHTGVAEADPGLDFENAVDTLTEDLQVQFIGSVPAKGDAPAPPSLPPDLADRLEEKLARSADFSIKDFSVKQTEELRKRVLENQSAGGRTDRLVKLIEADYGVAKRKAAFIAENETSNLVAEFREDRFKAVGSSTYLWSTSEDEKVRPDHALLNEREFSWDNPPVCDRASGRRCNPGIDYNCRCVPFAVLNVAA